MVEPIVRPFLNPTNDKRMVLQDENARLHRADTTEEYKNQHHNASLLWPSSSPDFEPHLTLVGRALPTSLKPGTSLVHHSRAIPSSDGEVGQGTR